MSAALRYLWLCTIFVRMEVLLFYEHNWLCQRVGRWWRDVVLIAAPVTPTGQSGHLHEEKQNCKNKKKTTSK